MRTKRLFLFMFFCAVIALAYPQAWVWEKPINSTNNSIATDPNNNIVVLARSGTATLLSKFTKDGLQLWSKRLTKSASFTPSGSVVTDKNGNIYTYTEGFDSVNSQFTGVKLRGITKFNPQGNIVWHADFYGTHSYFSATETRLPIRIDENNNVYVSYYVQGFFMPFNIQLGSSLFPFNSFSSYYAYIATGSVTAAGTARWANTYSFNNSAFGGVGFANSIAVSGNKLFIGGYLGKAKLYLDNSVVINNDRCTAWLASIDCSTGISLWYKSHDLFYFCSGAICGCSYPSLNASTETGKVVLTNNLNGAFVFKPLDTIAAITANGQTTVKSYYTIYDTLGNPVKGKIIETVPDQFSYNEILAGSRNSFLFVQYRDTLRKVDTGFNPIWKVTLPAAASTCFIPKNSNDIITTYTKSGVIYLAKMTDSAGVVSGKTYADWDNSGTYTPGDSILSNILISTNAAPVTVSGNDSGKYYLYAAPGTYNIAANFNHPYYQFLPSAHAVTISQYTDSISGKDFRLTPLFAFTDVAVNFSGLNTVRPGHLAYYSVSAKNYGTSAQNTDVGLKLPSLTSYNGIAGAVATLNSADSVTIAFGNINPFETKTATLFIDISTAATLNDTLRFYPVAYPFTGDAVKTNNTDTLIQPVRTSFDPNEKEVNVSMQPLADSQKAIIYTIHFQNTGTDTAFYVRLADTVSSKLDPATFNFIASSHPVSIDIKGDIIQFLFNTIQLPDSSHNKAGSMGYIKFSLKPVSLVNTTDTIYNKAAIYFDFNSPVITNTVKSWYYANATLPVTLVSFDATAKSNTALLRFITAQETGILHYIIEHSNDGTIFNPIGTVLPAGNLSSHTYYFTDNNPFTPISFYRLKIVDQNGRFRYSNIAAARFSNEKNSSISIFPNPASDNLLLTFNGTVTTGLLYYRITDAAGKIMLKKSLAGPAAGNSFVINVASLPSGLYTIELVTATTDRYSQKFVINH